MTKTRDQIPEILRDFVRRNVDDPSSDAVGTLFEQKGEMRLAPDKPWMPFTAEQTMAANRTAFLWHARVRMAPLVTCVVEDAFEDGHGRLDAKVFGVVPVAHARGVEVDRGEVQRYLAELAWCPLAFVRNPSLRFQELTDDCVRVWHGDEDTYVDLTFHDGEIVAAATSTRVRGDLGSAQEWRGEFSDVRDFGGIRAPARGQVAWQTPDGPYLYWRGELTSLGWRT